MSSNNTEEVNQVAGTAGGKVATLTFFSYQQSQGGKYECRVAVPGNSLEKLSVCIGEHYTFLPTVKPATYDNRVFLVPSTY